MFSKKYINTYYVIEYKSKLKNAWIECYKFPSHTTKADAIKKLESFKRVYGNECHRLVCKNIKTFEKVESKIIK